MIRLCRTHKLVIGSIHQVKYSLNLSHDFIHELLRCLSGFLRLPLYLLSMLVGSRHKEYIIPLIAFKACHRIRQNDFISITDMRFSGSIGNCSGDIIRLLFHGLSFFT